MLSVMLLKDITYCPRLVGSVPNIVEFTYDSSPKTRLI